MSMPNIPNLNPDIDIDREDVINILLASIGFEELGLAHIINAEAEKIQYALGTLKECDKPLCFEEIMAINKAANDMLKDVIKQELILDMKLDNVKELMKDRRKKSDKDKDND